MPGCAICTYTLPAGRRCGAVALRGRAFCYHHDRSPRRILQDTLDVKLTRYRRELDTMDLPRLLEALLEKLDLISTIIPGYPEARLILGLASCRLAGILSNYIEDTPAPSAEPDPRRIFTADELDLFAETLIRAKTDPPRGDLTPISQSKPSDFNRLSANPKTKAQRIN